MATNHESRRRDISLGFCDKHFKEGQHICYIYTDDDERRRVLSDYDARRFDGAVLMDVLQVHPVMIVRGQLV